MAASVQFLEKMKDLQDINYESENKRLQLEQELNSYVKSDTRMERLKAVRLQNYWKKICEDEKRSQWRNEQLLQDFDRVDSHMAELGARTERLRVMKKQYEEYIERMYPQWKEKVIYMKQQREHMEKRDMLSGGRESGLGHFAVPPSAAPAGHSHHSYAPSSVSTSLSPSQASMSVTQSGVPTYTAPSMLAQGQPVAPQFQDSRSLQYAATIARQSQLNTEVRLTEVSRAPTVQIQEPHGVHIMQPPDGYHRDILSPGQTPPRPGMEMLAPSAGSTLQTISSLPSGTDLTLIQARALANQSTDFSGAQTWESSDLESATGQVYRGLNDSFQHNRSSALHAIESESFEESVESPKQATVRPSKIIPGQGGASITIPDATGEDFDTGITDPSTVRSLTRDGSNHFNASPGRPTKKDGSILFDDEEPFSPHMTSPRGSKPGGRQASSPMRPASPGIRSRQNSQSPILGDKSEDRFIYPEADITLDGLYNLIDAVQEVLTMTHQQKHFYRTDLPPASVRNDIIKNCNKGHMLTHVDPTSISMVALEQLPLVVQNCVGGALLPDEYLYKPYPETDYDTIRLNIHPTSVRFWDRLCEHFVALVRYNIMDGAEIGELFGPQLIAEDSPYEDKANALLVDMLAGVEAVDPVSPGSTATLSSILTPKPSMPRPIPNEDVPPLDLPVSKSEDDDFTRKNKNNPNGQLTQSAAYRQLLGMGISTINSGDYEDSDDSDDVEKALTKSITSPRPKFSTAKATAVTAAAPPSPPPVNISSKPSARSATSSPELSLSLSPTSPPAYIPSTLASTGKSTMSSTGKSGSKKPGFNFGDSDTDEDVDLEGTGPGTKSSKHGEENDDFDFYG